MKNLSNFKKNLFDLLNVSSVCIINFLKLETKKMKPNIKLVRIYLKLFKNVLKRTTFPNQYSPLKQY